MKQLDVIQGTPAWLESRVGQLTGSLAPEIMGDGYGSRDRAIQKFLGILKDEISSYQQAIFDDGHQAEDAARDDAADVIGEPISPLVGVNSVSGLDLYASLDGVTFGGEVIWEHKHTGKEVFDLDSVPPIYYWQIEHNLLVSGATKCLLTITPKDGGSKRHIWYESVPDRRKALIAGWKAFKKDIELFERTDAEWLELAAEYRQLKAKADEIKERQDVVAEKLRQLAGHTTCAGGGLKVSVSASYERKQTAAAYIKQHKIDLPVEQLDEPVYSYRITLEK